MTNPPPAYADRLRHCADIAVERGEKYGDIGKNFRQTADILAAVFGINLEPHQIAKVLAAVKMARERNAHQRDNIDDLANYLFIADELQYGTPAK